MGLWGTLKKGWDMARIVIPVLPLPPKAKTVVSAVDDVERRIEQAVRDVKQPPASPTP
jgi:hypothetical protein